MLKKSLRAFGVLALSVLVLFQPAAAEANWGPVHNIVEGIRLTNRTINGMLAVLALHPALRPPVQMSFTTVGFSNNSWKLKLTKPGAQYLLEIWADTGGGTFTKGVEFSFTDANDGTMIIRPWVFITGYESTLYERAVYSHTPSLRTMTIDVINALGVNTTHARALLSQESGEVSIYLTALLNISAGGTATYDAYALAGRIKTASPNYATAKYGVVDQDGTLGFTWYVAANTDNEGFFDNTGWQSDGNAAGGDADHPNISDMTAGGLPSIAAVGAIAVAFADAGPPGF